MGKKSKVLLSVLWLGGVGLLPLWWYLWMAAEVLSGKGGESTGAVAVVFGVLLIIAPCVITSVLTIVSFVVFVRTKGSAVRKVGFSALSLVLMVGVVYGVYDATRGRAMREAKKRDAGYRADSQLAEAFARQAPQIQRLIAGQDVDFWVIGDRKADRQLPRTYRACVLQKGLGKKSGPQFCMVLAEFNVVRDGDVPRFVVNCVATEADQEQVAKKALESQTWWHWESSPLCLPLQELQGRDRR